MRTGIYVRVSTEEQAKEGYSIRAQEDKLRTLISIRDWTFHDVYADEGISGKDVENRPALNRLLEDVKKGDIENVLVFKVDRLTRSTKDLIELVELFNAHNCAFNSLNENLDTHSATGRMFLKIIGIFAEFERENMVERVKMGFERKVKEGYSLCSRTAYGYDREKGEKVQQVNEEEANIVRQIFNMYLHDDCSMTGIATFLNAQGIPSKRDSLWNTKTVHVLLTNSSYIGKVRYQVNDADSYMEAEGKHEAIIDDELYFAVQEKLSQIAKVHRTKRPKHESFFTGVAVCAECGSKLTPKRSYKKTKNGGSYSYSGYRCLLSTKGQCKFSCTHKKLEEVFVKYIENIEDIGDDIVLEEIKPITRDIEAEKKSIESSIEKMKNKKREMMEQYIAQHISLDDYRELANMADDNIDRLVDQLKNLALPEEEPISDVAIVRNIKENWLLLSDREKHEFVTRFVDRIVIRKVEVENSRYYGYAIDEIEFVS